MAGAADKFKNVANSYEIHENVPGFTYDGDLGLRAIAGAWQNSSGLRPFLYTYILFLFRTSNKTNF
jgi:hypothetical protein